MLEQLFGVWFWCFIVGLFTILPFRKLDEYVFLQLVVWVLVTILVIMTHAIRWAIT